jgi:hypothetical protein
MREAVIWPGEGTRVASSRAAGTSKDGGRAGSAYWRLDRVGERPGRPRLDWWCFFYLSGVENAKFRCLARHRRPAQKLFWDNANRCFKQT